MMGLGVPEMLVIAALVFLVFGAKKVPEFFRSLGQVPGAFKKGMKDGEAFVDDITNK